MEHLPVSLSPSCSDIGHLWLPEVYGGGDMKQAFMEQLHMKLLHTGIFTGNPLAFGNEYLTPP